MGAQDNGLSLEGLARRLEALELENERMCSENAELRRKVATLEGSGTRRDEVAALRGSGMRRVEEQAPGFEGQLSRGALLSKAGAVAVGSVAAAALMLRDTRQAKATHYDPGISVDYVNVHNDDDLSAVTSQAPNGRGVWGSGVIGVFGDGKGSGGIGVKGRNPEGVAVQGEGPNGVYGLSPTGGGYGAVVGRSTGQGGIGAYGECLGGTGLKGVSSSGYGGQFEGGKAQLMLKPKSGSAGKPTSGNHSKGEIYMDSAGALFVCTAGGTPGTWRKVTTTAA